MKVRAISTGVTVTIADEKADKFIGHGFVPVEVKQVEPKKAAKKPAKKSTKKDE